MGERKAYVKLAFKNGNVLVFHIQGSSGDEFISASGKHPPLAMEGWQQFARPATDATASTSVLVPSTKALQAYEVLLGAAVKGDQSYFVTFREVVAGYKAWDAVMDFVPITATYPLGTPLQAAVETASRSSALCDEAKP